MPCKRNLYNIKYNKLSEQKTIGDKIRCVRLHAGLTIEQLAEKIEVDRVTLIRNETNQISEDFINSDMLLKIEDICNVPRYSLFDDYLLYYETQQLKADRKSLGITQATLGKYLNVSNKVISRWEQKINRPSQQMWQSTIKIFQELRELTQSVRPIISESNFLLSSIDKEDSINNDCAESR